VMGVEWSGWWVAVLATLPFLMYADWRWMTPQELKYTRRRGGFAGKEDLK
jgi:hypothetical protein